MAKRPEGLSPNFNSIVSPQIPSSLTFSWTFIKSNATDTQLNAEVNVYGVGSTTALFTLQAGTDESVEAAEQLAALPVGENYEWEVKVTAADNTTALSGRKPFRYMAAIGQEALVWPAGPASYEYIGTRKYFTEIRENALKVLSDYVVDDASEIEAAELGETLFLGDVVPSRADFDGLKQILALIAEKEYVRNFNREEVIELIRDGLGAEDLIKIYEIFDGLVKIAPQPPANVYLSFEDVVPLHITDGSASNRNSSDYTIDVTWNSSPVSKGTCVINFDKELSEDVLYYGLELEAGFSDFKVMHKLYFRLVDVVDGRISFTMDHVDFEALSVSKQTVYTLNAFAVDKRAMISSQHYLVSNVPGVPIGFNGYELQNQRFALNGVTIMKDDYEIYKGPLNSYTHRVASGAKGIYKYSVRVLDRSGEYSPWYRIDDAVDINPPPPPPPPPTPEEPDPPPVVDTLQPPGPPKVYVGETTDTTVEFKWWGVQNAINYEIRPLNTSIPSVKTFGHRYFKSGLYPNAKFTVDIRALNRAGASPWVRIAAMTSPKKVVVVTPPPPPPPPPPPTIEKKETSPSCRTWRTSYKVLYQNGTVAYPAGGYLYEKDNVEAMHGEWIELRDKYESGSYVKKGTRWGNHKTVFFFNYKDWQAKLKGKEILEVKFYIRRKNTDHGYPNDGRFLNVYAHNYATASSLPAPGTGPQLGYHFKVNNLDLNRGQGAWITLPKSYGENLRDGKIKGIALHNPSSTSTPYSYMRFDANTLDFRIKYR